MPKFSVIIPLYNKVLYIKATLESVLDQTFTDFEVVIVDDGSTDAGADVVLAFTDNRINYFRKENGGVSSARNFAMRQATGEFFAFIDADDIWYHNHLEELAKAIDTMPHLRVFSSLFMVENSVGKYKPYFSGLNTAALQEADFFEASLGSAILSSYTTAIHNRIPESVGYFDENLPTCEDTDYWIKIGFKYKVGVINKVTALHTHIPESLSNTKFTMARATYFEKFISQEKENPAAKKMIDINRYSLALRCKMAGEHDAFKKMVSLIDAASLSGSQKIILSLPGGVLRLLQKAKAYLNAIS